ncbi:M56 family metallopeptidase [Amnibacterium endophyticum]|uniref:M56 family metallopeptidase n=1 Tax=Amnibacterium endophyticum TaxID=2109337 RepID=A0ABW4LH51_9MICO
MAVLAALLGVALLCILAAPRLLTTGRTALRFPRATLALWLAVFATGAAAVLGSALWTAMLVVAFRETVVGVGWIATVVAWLALATCGAGAALVLTRLEPVAGGWHAADRRVDLLAAACAIRTERTLGLDVVVVAGGAPAAFSSRAQGGRVVVTEALVGALPADGLQAVVAHERAHLRGRHDLLLRLATLNAACLPALFGARAFDRAAHLLVELVADDAAARVCGAEAVASALSVVGDATGNEWPLVRSARLRERRPLVGARAATR